VLDVLDVLVLVVEDVPVVSAVVEVDGSVEVLVAESLAESLADASVTPAVVSSLESEGSSVVGLAEAPPEFDVGFTGLAVVRPVLASSSPPQPTTRPAASAHAPSRSQREESRIFAVTIA
jgi:hypothetical protein